MNLKNLLQATAVCIVFTGTTAHAQNTFPATGSVGIGTTTPSGILDVRGIQWLRDANYPLLMLSSTNPASTSNVGIHFDGSGGADMHEIRFGKYTKTGTWQSNPFRFSILAPDGSFFMNSGGKLGLGTYNPGYKLHVAGDIYADQGSLIVSKSTNEGGSLAVYNHGKTTGGTKAIYTFYNMTSTYGNKFSLWNYPMAGNGTERFSVWDNGDFTFHNASSFPTLYLLNSGKVGIGLPDQSKLALNYKLFVNGGILTDIVQVATYPTWADYVFAADYRLNPLSEVEAFIKQHKHLSNIPSAKEVKEQGINLAEMQAKQMEKIEELTLYIIQINKKVELLEKQLDQLND